MNLFCCAVFDSAVQSFGRPFFVPARQAAVRSFTDEVKRVDPENAINRHPEDYELYALFEFDDNTGVVSGNQPEILVRGKDVQS